MNSIRTWLLDPWNSLLVLVLLFALALRLYYFTVNSTVWWDEAEYLSTSLHWAQNVPYILNSQRPPLFPLLTALIFFFNGTEFVVRLFLELLPSVLVVFFTYLLGKDMFDKRVGVVAAFGISVFWLLLFNTTRIHVDALATLLQTLVLWTFWRGYVLAEKKYLYFLGVFLALAFLTKFTAGLLGLVLLLFVLLKDRFAFLSCKKLWFAVGIFVLILLPYLYWSSITFGNAFAFVSSSHVLANPAENFGKDPLFWGLFSFIPAFFLPAFFVLFLFGLMSLYPYLIGCDVFLKEKNRLFLAHLLLLLVIAVYFAFFIFIQRAAEDRWLLPLAVPLFLFMSLGVMFAYLHLTKLHKILAVVVLVGILLFGAYGQLQVTHDVVMAKKDTYLQVKEAALWMAEHSLINDTLVSGSGPQTTYYSRRRVLSYADYDTWYSTIEKYHPKFMTYSIFERHPDWMVDFLRANEGKTLIPVQAYFADPAQTQVLLVIYEIKSIDFIRTAA